MSAPIDPFVYQLRALLLGMESGKTGGDYIRQDSESQSHLDFDA
ncbi:hypothetical protein [Synechococcus sp. PCC 7336]|nr:hypothetical protein [Synechococcus sp. PCC 7336]